MSEQILQQEDTVSADRKVRIIFDPRTGKSRKITSVMHRQNFNNAKYGNRKDKDEDDEGKDKDKDDDKSVKEEKSQIKFVTGNDVIATQVGQEKMKKDKIKKIAEAIIKKAVKQIAIDKNVGIKEIPTNESTDETAVDMVNESVHTSSVYSHIRELARKAMNEGDEGDPHAYHKWKQKEIDDKADREAKNKPKETTYQVHGKGQNHGSEHKTLDAAVAHRNSLKDHPDHKFMSIQTINRIKEGWEPEKETKAPEAPEDAELKKAAKKNKEALDKISKAFAKKKVDESWYQKPSTHYGIKASGERHGQHLSKNADDEHYEKQSPKMKDAINHHLRTGKSYKDSVSAAQKHVKEEAEQIDELKKSTLSSYVSKAKKDVDSNLSDAAHKARKGDMSGVLKINKRTTMANKALDKLGAKSSADTVAPLKKAFNREEVEQIDELKKSTLGSYIQKASASAAEAGNEAGFKAGAKQPKYNTSDTTHTEKKRAAGIATAVKKLTKEDVEELSELSKTTLGDYIKGASKDASTKILTGATKGNNKDITGANKDFRTAAKRNSGIKKAVDKLTKEGTEMSKLTFKQFVEQLDEMVEFVVTNEDVEQILEYTPGAGGVTKVQGRSYGANYHDPEGDDDADDKPAAKPAAKPAEAPAKKGRGRPAGSYGSYKARSTETRAAAAAKSAASKAASKAAKSN